MENQHLLLLQYLIATFEGQEEFAALTDEADRLIFEHVNVAPVLTDPLPRAAQDLKDALDAPYVAPVKLPEKLAALAAMEPSSSCKGCGTPNPSKDEGNNCEICGYPGLI